MRLSDLLLYPAPYGLPRRKVVASALGSLKTAVTWNK